MRKTADGIAEGVLEAGKMLEGRVAEYAAGMDAWGEKDAKVVEEVAELQEALKTRLKDDWTVCPLPPFPQPRTMTNPRADCIQPFHLDPNHHQIRPRHHHPRSRHPAHRSRHANVLPRPLCRARKSHNTTQHTHHATSLRTLTTSLSPPSPPSPPT